MDPRVVTFANQKGGVGKTTTVACLGAALAERGHRVLLVDLDPQACLTFSVGLDPDAVEPSMYEVMLGQVDARAAIVGTPEGPDLLPASIELAGCEARLLPVPDREYRLRQALTRIAEHGQPYEFVLVDCPPTLGMLTINGLTAADELVIPLQCETLAYRGVGLLLDTVTIDVVGVTNPGLKVLGVLPTLFDGRTAHSREVLADIADRYGVAVLEPPIPRTIRFAEAPAVGRTLLSTDSSGKGARAYRELAAALVS